MKVVRKKGRLKIYSQSDIRHREYFTFKRTRFYITSNKKRLVRKFRIISMKGMKIASDTTWLDSISFRELSDEQLRTGNSDIDKELSKGLPKGSLSKIRGYPLHAELSYCAPMHAVMNTAGIYKRPELHVTHEPVIIQLEWPTEDKITVRDEILRLINQKDQNIFLKNLS